MPRATILLPAYSRPRALEECLGALAKCRGVGDHLLLVRQDHDEATRDEVSSAIARFDACEKKVTASRSRLGHNRSHYELLVAASRIGSRVIVLADDLILSQDALEFFDRAIEEIELDGMLYTCTAVGQRRGDAELMHTRGGFERRAWGTSAVNARHVLLKWCFKGLYSDTVNSKARNGRLELYPDLGRVDTASTA